MPSGEFGGVSKKLTGHSEKLTGHPGVFSLELAAYSVMSNHYHIILYINLREAGSWSDDEVIVRWHQLFKSSMQCPQYAAGEAHD